MVHPACDEATFINLIQEHGPSETARRLGVGLRSVMSRRRNIEKASKMRLDGPAPRNDRVSAADHPARIRINLTDGIAIIGSDAHYWPGIISTAHRAFVHLIGKLKPAIIVMNGDVLDGAGISRHAPIGWESRPSLIQEVEACKERLGEIVKASLYKKGVRRIWPLGNHDARFETRLATVAPEYANIHGIHLRDHFPDFEPCWSVWINDDVVVKHRLKGGIHATHNNALWAGKTTATGHLHSLKVTPFNDYNGPRWGIDTGTLAQVQTDGMPVGDQFLAYTEDGPLNWRAGFAVLTFRGGRLMWPEVCHVISERDGLAEFRGELIEV